MYFATHKPMVKFGFAPLVNVATFLTSLGGFWWALVFYENAHWIGGFHTVYIYEMKPLWWLLVLISFAGILWSIRGLLR